MLDHVEAAAFDLLVHAEAAAHGGTSLAISRVAPAASAIVSCPA